MVRFAVVGVINTTIDIGLFWLLQGPLSVPYLIANGLSYSAGTANSFVLNKAWTFADTRRQGQVLLQFPIFVAVNVVSLGLSSIIHPDAARRFPPDRLPKFWLPHASAPQQIRH